MSDANPTDDVRAPAWGESARPAGGPLTAPAPADASPADASPDDASPDDASPDDASADDAPLAPDGVADNLRRYARWQWRDFWQRRGLWMAGAALLCTWVLVGWAFADRVQFVSGAGAQRVPLPRDAVLALSHLALAAGGVLAGLLGVGGLVAREREHGLQRFLFAKPVNPLRYYLQAFAVHAAGSMMVLLGTVVLVAAGAPAAVPVGSLLAVAAAGYLLGGGATFLVSTLWRYDAPVVAGWLLAGFPAVALAENGYRFAQVVQWLFPQAWALALLKGFAGVGPAVSVAADQIPGLFVLAAVAASVWGVVCLLAGALVLRRRAVAA